MIEELIEGENTGFIAVEPIIGQDYIRGGQTNIDPLNVNPSGDWRAFLPTNVAQLMKTSDGVSHGDTNACVSFAAGQCVETILNHQIATGAIDPAGLQWLKEKGYLDANGKVLLSKRHIAKVSGTDPSVGNTLPVVWYALRHQGAVPEALWPMPTASFDQLAAQGITDIQQYYAVYYAPILQSVLDLGTEFADRFPIMYEWLSYPAAPQTAAQLLEDLKVAPMEIATAVCTGWNTEDPIHACGPGTQHATMLTYVEPTCYDILDHYNPYQKQFAIDYNITYAMRGVVGAFVPPPPPAFTFTRNLFFGLVNSDVTQLQQKLGVTPATGFFGPRTFAAVCTYQTSHGIPATGFVGPLTRAQLNT